MAKSQGDIQSNLEGITRWALSWEARSKLIAVVFFIFGVISLKTTSFAFLAFAIAIIGSLAMGLSIVLLLKRYLIIFPFLLLMTVPLIIGGGFPIEVDRISFAALIFLKAITCMTVMTILLHTQTVDDFMDSLAHLKVPPIVITILLLSYRYVFLFFDDIQKMQLAARARFFSGGISIRNLKVYGQLTGGLLIKSLDRAENVYNAMTARCFNGTIRFREKRELNRWDVLKTFIPFFLIVTLIAIEKVYI
ncbi:cobalt ECF transporter T component CbiQ [Anaerobacillus isosaccharinicus]|uniref:Cobalt ECF transporter T component CbiQ n=1 Tax=Anaerobacillus isosaccharinicus TaxID=1532552 RepID=A0A1S2LIS2_9BACI|nr:cobalt ECF transporter T component CbiQ [Anaerobacillus isosaccharinicus]MBA5588677.1 cobalt ECF transporter T component CbiQ [Anaerobacillus isosaccharinicus]QOY37918.1 cobalt ECF transporter T component CbiQ [Anaerobacillus isosaccharinicus]